MVRLSPSNFSWVNYTDCPSYSKKFIKFCAPIGTWNFIKQIRGSMRGRRMSGFEARWCRGKLTARISQPDVPKFSASDSIACGGWRKKGSVERGCSSAARGAARGWAAKLKFLRSSDDAATHKKFKRFTLWLVLLAVARVSPFFPNINSPLPPLCLRLTTASFSIHPDTGSTPSPLAEMLTAGNFYPEKLGALLRSSSSRYPSRYREASMRVIRRVS